MLNKLALLLAVIATLVVSFPRFSGAEDSYLFERNGFTIHYVGNGGNCHHGCEWIAIEGTIPTDAGALFEQYVTQHKLTGIEMNVSFNSQGGSLVGGIRLGRAIRKVRMSTSIGKTVPDGQFYTTGKGVCLSACAYAFLGGVHRFAEAGEYGVHQFYTRQLLKNPEGKVFSPVDFSVQQTITGLLLSYVIEMGASPELVVEANKTLPTRIHLLSAKELKSFKVSYDPDRYGEWKLAAYRKGLVAYSRTESQLTQMTLFCRAPGHTELMVNYTLSPDAQNQFRKTFAQLHDFSLLNQRIQQSKIRLTTSTSSLSLHIPLTNSALNALRNDKDPNGAFSVGFDEPHVFQGVVYETINPIGLADSVRLTQRNCID